jgi:outer membrane protein OmpA-like peptidoglycan-associated protein
MRNTLIYLFLLGFICNSLNGQTVINPNVVKSAILIQEVDINTASFEFSPVFYGPYIAFVNDRGNSIKYDNIKNTPFFDLSFAALNLEGNLSRQASFPKNLSTENQEGPFSFGPDQNEIFFTRTDPVTGYLSIYHSKMIGGDWSNAVKIEILQGKSHVCHPSISESGDFMAFAASNAETAQMDLYLARRDQEGWGSPVHFADYINSSFNDWFPRMIGDSIIIFSSDRPSNFGGLDMYGIKWMNGKWSSPELLPSPINSDSDDFGLVIGKEIAYFSSNRAGGKGKDDLYRIEYKGDLIYDPNIALVTININVKNKLTLEDIPQVRIKAIPVTISETQEEPLFDIDLAAQPFEDDALILKLKPKESLPTKELISNENGEFSLKITKTQRYAFALSAPGYTDYATLYSYKDFGGKLTYVLEPSDRIGEDGTNYRDPSSTVIIPTTAGSVIVLDNIYYEFNSHVISSGAANELEALAVAMRKNPKMKVRLSAHTDSRGTKIYNQRLSEKRALSAKDYLINNGISGQRIEAVGFGELRLRNKCEDNIACTEEEHSYNRRTEVTILSN